MRLNLTPSADVPRNINVIIGRNGTCKTTLLRCIALGLCEKDQANALISEAIGPLVSSGKDSALISIKLIDPKKPENAITVNSTIRSRKGREFIYSQSRIPSEEPINVLVCAYGAGRGSEGIDQVRPYQITDSVYSLFNYEHQLISTELTIRRLTDYIGEKKYDIVLSGLKKVLGLAPQDKIELLRGGGVEITGRDIGDKIPLDGWADGYRRTFIWVLDIYAWAMRADKLSGDGYVTGILLVDEPEQHLHPSLQSTIIPNLKLLFPNLQMFITTHSPMTALNVEPDELIVLKRDGFDVKQVKDVPDYYSYSSQDMLEDDNLFATVARRQEYLQIINRHEELQDIPKTERTTAQTREMKTLAQDVELRNPKQKKSPLAIELERIRKKFDI